MDQKNYLGFHFFEKVRECQLRVSRAETDVYAAIMDEYLTNIMKILRQELVQVGEKAYSDILIQFLLM